MAAEPEQMSPLPVMLQTGYLTIASCAAALQQIKAKQYAQKYQNSGKEIVLPGAPVDLKSTNQNFAKT